MKLKLVPLLVAVAWLCGCRTYHYRIAQPATGAPLIADQSVRVRFEPLDYRFVRIRERLAVSIANPTDDKIVLLGNRSFVIDPRGETHPVRERAVGPHSYIWLTLPPVPFTYASPDYWGWGGPWRFGWYDTFWGGCYGPGWYGPPPLAYNRVLTSYDWEWKSGSIRLHLAYDRAGKAVEHEFELVRESGK